MNKPLYTLEQLYALLDRQSFLWHALQSQIDDLLATYDDDTYSDEKEAAIAAQRDAQTRVFHVGRCLLRAIEVWYTTTPGPGASFRKLKGPEPLTAEEIDTINQFAMEVAAEGVTR